MELREFREKFIEKTDILDKVKKLFLIPEMDVMTTRMVADYFEVEVDTIQRVYQRNKDEVKDDGVASKNSRDLRGFWSEQNIQIKNFPGGFVVKYGDTPLNFSNGNVKLFSKRAVLRIAMLLRDSKVAKEIRTQLLNSFEHTAEEKRTAGLMIEKDLMLKVGRAYTSGDIQVFAEAAMEHVRYLCRHMDKLNAEIDVLSKDNKILAEGILDWTDRASLNKAVRILAGKCRKHYGEIWKELYDELRYKFSIGLSQRGSKPYIQHIKEDEWGEAVQSFAALCEKCGFSPTAILAKAKLDDFEPE